MMTALVVIPLALLSTLAGMSIAAAVVVALVFDWNDLRPVIEDQVRATTGRNLEIAGDLGVDLGTTSTVRIRDVRFANPSFVEPETMARVGLLEVAVDLPGTLLERRIDLPRIRLQDVELGLVRTAEGRANWQFGQGATSGSGSGMPIEPEIGRLEIERATISFDDARTGRNGRGRIDSLSATSRSHEGGKVEIDGQGQLEGEPVQINGHVGALPRLAANTPYPVDLQISSGPTSLAIDGTIEQPLAPKDFDLVVDFDAPEPSRTLARLGLPEVLHQPLKLAGRLGHHEQTWSVGELQGSIGDQDVAGSARIDLATEPPEVQADLDWNALKPLIEAAVQPVLGREFRIRGQLEVDVGAITRVSAGGLALANPDWAQQDWMAELDQARIELDLWQAIDGTFRFPRIELTGTNLVLARNADGAANWTFDHPGSADDGHFDQDGNGAPPAIPEIDRLVVAGGTLAFQDAVTEIDFEGDLGTIEVEDEQGRKRDDFEIDGSGTLAGEPFDLDIQVGGLQSLRDQDAPYPLELTAALGETSLEADGTLDQPLAFRGFDFDFRLAGPNPGPLLAGFDLPRLTLPPFELSGRLDRKDRRWRLTKADGTVGDSDVQGSIAVDFGQEPAWVDADLTSRQLDLDDLGGLIGLDPSGGEGDRSSSRQGNKVLPTARFDPAAWQNLNLDVQFRGHSVQARNVPLSAVMVDANLEDGVLTLDPLKADIAGGQAILFATIDATRDNPHADLDLRLNQLGLDPLLPETIVTNQSAGKLSGRVKLTGTGRSIEQLAASGTGRVGLTMEDGRINSLLLEAASLDLAEVLGLMLGEDAADREVPIRCLVADFEAEEGVLRSQVLVLDTTDLKITGSGTIDLGPETLDLVFRSHPKDPSLFSATSPIRIEGPIADPSISAISPELLAKGAAALALGVALPAVGALIPFVDLGGAENSPCSALITEAREAAKSKS